MALALPDKVLVLPVKDLRDTDLPDKDLRTQPRRLRKAHLKVATSNLKVATSKMAISKLTMAIRKLTMAIRNITMAISNLTIATNKATDIRPTKDTVSNKAMVKIMVKTTVVVPQLKVPLLKDLLASDHLLA